MVLCQSCMEICILDYIYIYCFEQLMLKKQRQHNKKKETHARLQNWTELKLLRPVSEIFVTLTPTSVSLSENEVSGCPADSYRI